MHWFSKCDCCIIDSSVLSLKWLALLIQHFTNCECLFFIKMPRQMWSKRQRGMSLPPGRPQETPHHLSRTLTFPAPTPPTTRAWLKTTRTLAAIPLIGPNAGASMRATTSIWSAPHLVAILWVIALHIHFLLHLFNNSVLMVWRAYFGKWCSDCSKP